ncbi:hypothetical protein DFJ58DRAFT_254649 [Suillus subalutaceus]|uniref:uncharacterized protein n=1 Tax=Suillus subalutaceus TaxID=48586 RepID=UPI001B884687|nr:uncharacterized protein DFJ58DRAFT_254649 [Suillus subalutaceus]KAG1875425.1 hypothetical protein DFJ58DRAFT_254649 [Suillus subalutaceus]
MRQEHISIAGLPHVHCRPSPASFNPDATLFPTQILFHHLSSSRFSQTCIVSVSISTSVSISYRKRQNPILSFFLFLGLPLWFCPVFFSLHLILSVILQHHKVPLSLILYSTTFPAHLRHHLFYSCSRQFILQHSNVSENVLASSSSSNHLQLTISFCSTIQTP